MATTARTTRTEKPASPRKPASRKPAARKAALPAPVAHDAIAQRAYELHLAGGGDAFTNWLDAERELGGAA